MWFVVWFGFVGLGEWVDGGLGCGLICGLGCGSGCGWLGWLGWDGWVWWVAGLVRLFGFVEFLSLRKEVESLGVMEVA